MNFRVILPIVFPSKPIRSYLFLSTDSEKNVRSICLIRYSVGGTFLLPHRSGWHRFLQNHRMSFAAVGRLHLSVVTGLFVRIRLLYEQKVFIQTDVVAVFGQYGHHFSANSCISSLVSALIKLPKTVVTRSSNAPDFPKQQWYFGKSVFRDY